MCVFQCVQLLLQRGIKIANDLELRAHLLPRLHRCLALLLALAQLLHQVGRLDEPLVLEAQLDLSIKRLGTALAAVGSESRESVSRVAGLAVDHGCSLRLMLGLTDEWLLVREERLNACEELAQVVGVLRWGVVAAVAHEHDVALGECERDTAWRVGEAREMARGARGAMHRRCARLRGPVWFAHAARMTLMQEQDGGHLCKSTCMTGGSRVGTGAQGAPRHLLEQV